MYDKAATLIILLSLAGLAPCQAPVEADPVTVDDIVALLGIGTSDAEIIALCEDAGWPIITEREMLVLRENGMGRDLENRFLKAFRGKSDLERLAEQFEVHEGTLPAGTAYTILAPRKWRRSVSKRRLHFHEHEQEGLLLRRSLFVWFYEGRDWRASNARALAHVVVGACRRRLAGDGMRMGGATEEILIHKRSGKEYPFFHAIVSDARTRVRSLLAVTVRIDEEVGVVTVAGFLTRIDDDSAAGGKAKSRLSEMISTLRFSTPAESAPAKR